MKLSFGSNLQFAKTTNWKTVIQGRKINYIYGHRTLIQQIKLVHL